MTSEAISPDAKRLIDHLREKGRCLVAYSGGVDSAVVAAAALRADRLRGVTIDRQHDQGSIAVTADSPSVSREQLETAKRVAREIGLRHEIVLTHEMDNPNYQVNDRRRCFYCKQTLYSRLSAFAASIGFFTILSGTNADDLGDYRPGIEAGLQAGVATPLADLKINKASVRQIARAWGLSVADRPAQPCLSSRLAYGVAVTPERLLMIEKAEAFLRDRGYSPLRVRMQPEEHAKIEVAREVVENLSRDTELAIVSDHFYELGFQSVSVDPEGFRSGSLNEVFQIRTAPSAFGSK